MLINFSGWLEEGWCESFEKRVTVLAGLRLLSRLGGGGRRRKVKIQVMEWWRKVVFPVRRAWLAVSARVKSRKNGGGLLKLHDDIQTCGYEDVQIMWEMLRRTESEVNSHHARRKNRWCLRNYAWFRPDPDQAQ